ncbi:MAG: 30S ribosomal protein S12 methylthiotransferase RimO [Lachnospiraceae bacterium]|nr:30S ribosomal protein S12 methylthiotransferase RimO [Lachnospiraceae bacterium]
MKLLFISLGCDKNLVDSEMMLGLLNQAGYTITDNEQEAEVIIVNTCSFIQDAKEESIQTLLEMGQLKENGVCKVLIAAGCLAQRYHQEIAEEIPEVDGIVGTASYDAVVSVVEAALRKERKEALEPIDRLPVIVPGRLLTTGGWYAYLKIAEGCDKHCTYCIIPKIRGKYRSIPMEDLLLQAEELAKQGVKELILVAQETTIYGQDLYGKRMLPALLQKLAAVSGIVWIRILYCYPEEITDELIEVIQTEKKICHYLDIPIQHASDSVLQQMGRKTNQKQLIQMIEKLRQRIPDIVLRTTLIAGFPGETQQQHEEVMAFVDKMEFERLGVFAYSAEEDTAAAHLPNPVAEEVKERWRDEIMELQQEIAFERAQDQVGRQLMVLIEGKLTEENAYIGRSYMDAPNVDGYVFVTTDEELLSGDFVQVRITGAAEYDLIGEIDHEFT